MRWICDAYINRYPDARTIVIFGKIITILGLKNKDNSDNQFI